MSHKHEKREFESHPRNQASVVFNGSIRGFHPQGAGSNPAGRSKVLSVCGIKVVHVAWDHDYAGSNPATLTISFTGSSMVEHPPVKREVVGSNPTL